MIGRTYGRLQIVRPADSRRRADGKMKRHYLCRCQCGNEISVAADNLRSGNTKSCGCLRKEKMRENRCDGSRLVHGMTGTAEYRIWAHLKARCTNPEDASYPNYGGRGITVCDEWRASFEAFLKDMGVRPSARHTIERLDNQSGYSPGNCIWATYKQQANNTRGNRVISYDGNTMTLAQWSDRLDISYDVLSRRVLSGWTIHRAFTQPVRKSPSR